METDLIAIDPSDSQYYQEQYNNLTVSLLQYQDRCDQIKENYGGIQIAATESIARISGECHGSEPCLPDGIHLCRGRGKRPAGCQHSRVPEPIGEWQCQSSQLQPADPVSDNRDHEIPGHRERHPYRRNNRDHADRSDLPTMDVFRTCRSRGSAQRMTWEPDL